MADGLLTSIQNALQNQYQTTKRGLGLLVNDPAQFGKEAVARYFPTSEEVAQQRALEKSGGIAMNTPYMDKMFNLAQFQGSIKPTGLLQPAKSVPIAEDYRGSHVAPNATRYGATLDNLGAIMPENVYSSKGINLYGIGDRKIDNEWFSAAYKAKGKPDAEITIYRAVPKGVKNINNGDWVTTSKVYAQNHGESALNGEYEIISRKVKAKTLSSEGYPYEFGYNE